MNCDYNKAVAISQEYGDTFYMLESSRFVDNYNDMITAFKKYYENTSIAYSYKTNYLPDLCRIINQMGGCAEIVSEMELYLALKIGVDPHRIYYNGPYKKKKYIEQLLLLGGNINIDALYEIEIIREIAEKNPNKNFSVGVRCSLDINQEKPSRFGFDVKSGELNKAIIELNTINNVKVKGFHCHLPYRDLESFKKRMSSLYEVLKSIDNSNFQYISLGGGYFGPVDKQLADQLSFIPPQYEDYAKIVAKSFSEMCSEMNIYPQLIIEPGSALVANTFKLFTKIISIKNNRNKVYATLSGSTYNMNPSVKGVNRPISILSSKKDDNIYFENVDFVGYTCIEGDVLYSDYCGSLHEGDFVIFDNVGSYSLVMKPPFILPDIAVVEILADGSIKMIKRKQRVEEIFSIYEKMD